MDQILVVYLFIGHECVSPAAGQEAKPTFGVAMNNTRGAPPIELDAKYLWKREYFIRNALGCQ